jgi:hypothetical protein
MDVLQFTHSRFCAATMATPDDLKALHSITQLCCMAPPAAASLQPSLVTNIDLPGDWPNKRAAQQALRHVAATFTQLTELEISTE